MVCRGRPWAARGGSVPARGKRADAAGPDRFLAGRVAKGPGPEPNAAHTGDDLRKWLRVLHVATTPHSGRNILFLVQDLLGQMSRIREKATESEAVVRNITKEIQVLDLAKKNLILSMTTLKRLQMLGAGET